MGQADFIAGAFALMVERLHTLDTRKATSGRGGETLDSVSRCGAYISNECD
jgi:hypothetical protein